MNFKQVVKNIELLEKKAARAERNNIRGKISDDVFNKTLLALNKESEKLVGIEVTGILTLSKLMKLIKEVGKYE